MYRLLFEKKTYSQLISLVSLMLHENTLFSLPPSVVEQYSWTLILGIVI